MTSAIRKLILVLVAVTCVGAHAAAPPAEVTNLLSSRECTDLLPLDGMLYGALANGGVAVWDQDDPSSFTRWTAVDGLTANRTNALAWTGSHLWVATEGGGLTRVSLTGTGPEFRQYANLGGVEALSVSCVAGVTSDGGERVYYGLTEGGVGIIIDGFAGNIFSADSFPGLVDDRIRALVLDGDDLWIGTADGVSLYAGGVFQDLSAGLVDRDVRALFMDATGPCVATGDGLYRWSPGDASWQDQGGLGVALSDAVPLGGSVWCLTEGTGTGSRLRIWDGSAWSVENVPEGQTTVLAATDRIWLAGSQRPVDGNFDAEAGVLCARDGLDDWRTWTTGDLLFSSVDGVEITPDGTVWLGSRFAAGWSGIDTDGAWAQFVDLAETDPDSLGLMNFNGGVLSMESGPDGTLWITQFGQGGVIRYRPWIPDCDHITPWNSGLTEARIRRIQALDSGAVLLMGDREGVDLLTDPDAWEDPASWHNLPSDVTGLAGVKLRDAEVARADRVWFTSDDGGLVLWDTNGNAGPDSDLTLGDLSDDWWSPAVTTVTGSTYDFRGTKGLAVTPDGSLWAGGGGVARFRLVDVSDSSIELEPLGTWGEKIDPDEPGLLRGIVNDIAVDVNGHVWACHDAGLDRIRVSGIAVEIDGFTNAGAFESMGLGSVVGTSTIVGVTEGTLREIDVSDDGRTLVAGGDFGAVTVRVGRAQDGSDGPLASLTLYPNPFRPADHPDGLRVGGFDAAVTIGQISIQGGADVKIFDLEGKLVHRDPHVEQDEPFWDGLNLDGAPAASGTYLLRVELDGQVSVKPLAVLR